MRAGIRRAIPALMHHYPGFKPWDIDHYTFGEIEELISQLPGKD